MEKLLSKILLVSDMDDTLLLPDKSISLQNLVALQHFRELGGIFTVATGRSLSSYLSYQYQLKPDVPVILNNGALIYDDKHEKIIWNSVLPVEVKQYVNDIMLQFPQIGIEILSSNGVFVASHNWIIQRHIEREHLDYSDDIKSSSDTWFKVLFAVEPEDATLFYEYLQQYQNIKLIHSSQYYYEMLPQGSSKGQALRELIALMGFKDKFICAMGDYYNDLELLQYADCGIAVENAPDDVKSQADIVTVSNQNHALSEVVAYLIHNFPK